MRFKLLESKEDIQRFIDKFGEDTYNKFIKFKDRLKNNNLSVDITWYVKNVDPEALDQILFDVENRVVKDETGKAKLNRKKIAENENYVIYDVLDWQTAMNMGDGTVWCITGRYDTEEVKPSQAKFYFDDYKQQGVKSYLFFMPKKDGDKWCLVIYNNGDVELWSWDDSSTSGSVEVKRKLNAINSPNFMYDSFEYNWDKLAYITEEDDDGYKTLVEYIHKKDKHIVINEDIARVGDNAFEDCEMETIELPNTLRYIGTEAFAYCPNLKFIQIPDGVTYLRARTFEHCTSLKEIILPDSIKEIKPMCFRGCRSLTSIRIPSNVVSIMRDTFENCENLREISLNKVVDTYPAFDGCVNLKEVWSEQTMRIFFYMMEVCYENFYSPIFEFWEDVVVHCKDGDLNLNDWFYYTDNGNVSIRSKKFWETSLQNYDPVDELLKQAGLNPQ